MFSANFTSSPSYLGHLLVTGGCGFIGSAFVARSLELGYSVTVLDKLTYAGSLASLTNAVRHITCPFVLNLDRPFAGQPIKWPVTLAVGDICDKEFIRRLLTELKPTAVVHFAAESHVDRSITDPDVFINTNVLGTFQLLQQSLVFWKQLSDKQKESFRFVHVSTDEVFGALGEEGYFSEETPLDPRSPYSASKAGSDCLVQAWFHTYGLPTIITNCSNNYGPRQYPEKLIPKLILNAIE
jgi:dTDP-glucose 4,6-dehydratase